MNANQLSAMDAGRVVLDKSGTALQKQEDGTWLYADTPLGDIPLEGLEPFLPLTHGMTPWVFPPEVEEMLNMWVDDPEEASSEFFVSSIRDAMAEASLLGTYVPVRTDYEAVVEAMKQASLIMDGEGHPAAAKRLAEMAHEMECRHDDC